MNGDVMIKLPNYKLKKLKRIYLGGTGEMYLVVKREGEYLYKPAKQKWSSKLEPFRGAVQECAYRVQQIVDPTSAVECLYIRDEENVGSLQKRIKLLKAAPNFERYQLCDDMSLLTTDQINQFMREFVTDYLLCNYDSHGRNFITDEKGMIRGVDKEQSFRYLDEKESEKPSLNYSPNTERYGETEPIYNTIFRAYASGTIDIDFVVIDGYMKRVETYPNDQYCHIFQTYCHELSIATGRDEKKTLDKILMRKLSMRENVTTFFTDLTEMRDKSLNKSKTM